MKDKWKQKEKSRNAQSDLYKLLFSALCAVLVIVNAILIIAVARGSGWDFLVYMSAVAAFLTHQNPYDLSVITQFSHIPDLPFVYPPHTIAFFYPLYMTGFFLIFYVLWTILLISSIYLVYRMEGKELLYCTAVLSTGFISSFWSYLTGNLGILVLFFMALVFYFIIKSKKVVSAVILGIFGSIYIFPLIFSIALSLLKLRLWEKLKLIVTPFLVIGLIFALTFIAIPVTFSQYIAGMVEGTSNPYWEGAGGHIPVSYYINVPGPYWLINQILKSVGLHDSPVFLGLSILYIILVGYAWYIFYKKNRDDELAVFSYTIFTLFLLLPRLKPYNFTIILVPLFILTKDYDLRRKTVILFLASCVPLSMFLTYRISANIFTSFGQLWACLAVFFLISLYSRVNGVHLSTMK